MTDWQPIETAPRDGSNIVAWEDRVILCCWENGKWHNYNDREMCDWGDANPSKWLPVEPPS